MSRKAGIFYKGKSAGVIEETDRGCRFSYSTEWLADRDAVPVSLSLPLSSVPYESPVMIPFFDGLIPEGWILSLVVKNWKIDPRDRFGLLLAACRDCIGAVSVEGEP